MSVDALIARAAFTSLQSGRPSFGLVLDDHAFEQLLDNGLLLLGHAGDGLRLLPRNDPKITLVSRCESIENRVWKNSLADEVDTRERLA